MERYTRGKIYKIVCNITGKQYIGSTCKRLLSERLANHKADFKMYKKNSRRYRTSFDILEENDYYIELIELVPCSSKDELLIRERFHIQNNKCVNKCIPLQTEEELKESKKEWYNLNREKILEEKKEYSKLISEKNKEKYTCACGSVLTKSSKFKHEKSINHLKSLIV